MITDDAQFRLGEIKRKVTVYQRGDSTYVRATEEFNRMFKPYDQED